MTKFSVLGVLIVVLTIFIGSKITLVHDYPANGKNTLNILGLTKQLALTGRDANQLRGSSEEQSSESERSGGSEQFDGATSGGQGIEGGGAAMGGPSEPEDDNCDEEGNCYGQYTPDPTEEPDVDNEMEETVEDTNFQQDMEGDSSFTQEDIEENLEKISFLVDKLEDEDVEVANVGGSVALVRHDIAATINIPLEVDPDTKELFTKTKTGIKKIDVFPDQAVENAISAKDLSRVDSPKIVETKKEDKSSITSVVNLDIRDDVPVYEVSGEKDNKVLGFIPVTTKSTVYVAAQGGKVVGKKQSAFASIVGYISTK